MEKKDVIIISKTISDNLLPEIEKILEKHQNFSVFFKNIKRIVYLVNCDIYSDVQPNPAQEDGHYPHQNILQFFYKNKLINLDLNEGGILDDKFSIVPETGISQEIFKLNVGTIKYTYEEVKEAYDFLINKSPLLKSLKFQRSNLSPDDFQEFLETEYDIVFDDDIIYLNQPTYHLFLDVDLDTKDVTFTNQVQFFKDDEWQDPIDIEKEINNQLKYREE